MRWDFLAYEVTIRPWEHLCTMCGCWAYIDVVFHWFNYTSLDRTSLVILKNKLGIITAGSSLLFVGLCIDPETHNVFPPKSLNNIKHHHSIYVVCNYVMQNIFND